MFQFPGLPPAALCVQAAVTGNDSRRVRPFGDPRVTGHVRLTVAYRSLSRPSSASCAKASTVCPYHLPFDGSVHTYTQGRQRPCAIRCDLLEKENIVFKSRYAALKVRRGRPPGTGHCAPSGAATSNPSVSLVWRARPVGQGVKVIVFSKKVILPRKEVIQPHVPVRLPCYDFTPLTLHTFGASLLAVGPATSGADDSGGVTGGVYKARERLHRGVLIRDY